MITGKHPGEFRELPGPRSAELLKARNTYVPKGVFQIAPVDNSMLKKAELNGEFWFATADWPEVLKSIGEQKKLTVKSPSKIPLMRRDLSLVVDKNLRFSELKTLIDEQKSPILKKLNVFDVFEGKPLEEGKKAIAIAFYLGDNENTLTDEIADKTMNQYITAFEKAGAVIRR